MGMKAPFGSASVKVGQNTRLLQNTVDSYYDVTNDFESLILDQEQIVDVNGNGLYYDSAENIYIKVENADGTYYYSEEKNGLDYSAAEVNESELKKLMRDVHIVTYTFTGASSIVSLTNIKVVGSYEFTIVPGYDIHVPGSEGGTHTDAPTPEEEVQP
jgi:hypothetical protein